MLAVMTVKAAADPEAFLSYLDQVLCPKLRAGHVVVMDNLGAQKVAGVGESLEQTAAELLYLRPYSPDLNPIEKAWSKLKEKLRAAQARSVHALDQAIEHLLLILAFWFGPSTAVKFGPLGRHWLGFMDGATEA